MMHPFVALDLETTGLRADWGDQVLQIGAIAYGGEGPPVEFNERIAYERLEGHPYAMALNVELIREMANLDSDLEFREEPSYAYWDLHEFVTENCVPKPHPVGFNVGSFDLWFLDTAGNSKDSCLPRFRDSVFHHRAVEVGSLWATTVGAPSGSAALADLLGRDLTHDALEDARDAARLHALWVIRAHAHDETVGPAPKWATDLWGNEDGRVVR